MNAATGTLYWQPPARRPDARERELNGFCPQDVPRFDGPGHGNWRERQLPENPGIDGKVQGQGVIGGWRQLPVRRPECLHARRANTRHPRV